MSCIGCICEHCANSAECFDHCQERWMNRALTVMIASTGMARQDGRCGGTRPQVQDNRVLGSASRRKPNIF